MRPARPPTRSRSAGPTNRQAAVGRPYAGGGGGGRAGAGATHALRTAHAGKINPALDLFSMIGGSLPGNTSHGRRPSCSAVPSRMAAGGAGRRCEGRSGRLTSESRKWKSVLPASHGGHALAALASAQLNNQPLTVRNAELWPLPVSGEPLWPSGRPARLCLARKK